MTTAAWICLLSPLEAALLITLGGTRISRKAAGYLATLSVLVSFVAALVTLFRMLDEPAEERSHTSTLWTWLTAGDFEVGLSILVDPLSVFMMLVVSGVGFLIVAYSIGYMDGSDEERRYFAYMALFVFSMLLLVQSGDLLILLSGWGLVGLCSYLLIGYEQERPAAIAAAKKAFIMNALGDATMALALFLLIQRLGTLEYGGVFEGVDGIGGDWAMTLIALVQTDIKRVIAYSTMSQIGYMFLGAGLTSYGNSMFHLMTHAFFKALLFLAAGIVIHALVMEQDMRKMGGLGRMLPKTYAAMLIGALALAGMPPFAGFFSKDPLLAAALDAGAYGQLLWAVGLAGTFLTGLYAFRMIFIVFGGEPSPFVREHLHRPGHTMPALWMAWTVGALAVLSVIGGWIQFSPYWHPLSDFLEPVAAPGIEPTSLQDAVTSVLAVGLGLAGIAIAWWIYSARRAEVPRFALAQRVLEHKFYFDELYDAVFYRPAAWMAAAAIRFVEGPLIAGSIQGVTAGTRLLATRVTEAQTGLLRTYALVLGSGAALLTLVFLVVRA